MEGIVRRRRYGYSHRFAYRHDTLRPLVRAAFGELRKDGLICRMGFMCCMSCACAALEPMLKERKKSAAVYFHRQDDEAFRDGNDLHVRYAPLDDENTAAWEALGHTVVRELEKQGLIVEWDGDVSNTIVVKTKESYEAMQVPA